jgi:ABC-type multidrug transport system ATPase subunit
MPDAAEPILLTNVWKLYGQTTALAGLSLAVPPGSIFGFLGPNGAGKSTAIRILLGLQRPSRGTVSLFGRRYPAAYWINGGIAIAVSAPDRPGKP